MRLTIVLLLLGLAVCLNACSQSRGASPLATASGTSATENAAAKSSAKVDFKTQIEPILRSKCQTCHFPGGRMYDKLPFDRPETIRKLGTKLFTRIQAENDRRLISDFLAQ